MANETRTPGTAVGAAPGVNLHRNEGSGRHFDTANHRELQAKLIAERHCLALSHARAVVDLHFAEVRS